MEERPTQDDDFARRHIAWLERRARHWLWQRWIVIASVALVGVEVARFCQRTEEAITQMDESLHPILRQNVITGKELAAYVDARISLCRLKIVSDSGAILLLLCICLTLVLLGFNWNRHKLDLLKARQLKSFLAESDGDDRAFNDQVQPSSCLGG